eukprot:Protomagalhaensia_wolfi_Nauph_80__5749@NODE_6_length_6417_cov_46_439636_g4_i0_p2_GENE_NODE_6_length_6417_cov_46_439636_g4_i0NODE_6_length_6417_cov_46_439636_g4_i0_p2_ORF_typecomplete_len364_score74_01RNase_PH/PF01138_21/6_3e19RNase_PH/PF01138_21/4_3e03RNase_PH_C/PF03725_15/0_0077_NODE_6_length_6417_cov_46_439636_g4_i012022293
MSGTVTDSAAHQPTTVAISAEEPFEKTTLSGVSAAEKRYVREGITANCRTDGRRCDEYRSLEVATRVIPTAFGSARMRNTDCDVVCVVKADLCGTNLTNRNEGKIGVNVQFASTIVADSQLRLSLDDSTRANQRLAHALLDGPLNPKFVPREKLMVVKDRFVWKVTVDLMVLTLGGSIVDVSSAALVAALRDTRLPAIKVVLENEVDASGEQSDDEGEVASVADDEEVTDDVLAAADDGYFDMRLIRLSQTLSFDVDPSKEGVPFPCVDQIPLIVSIGQVEGNLVCDMTSEERLAVDTIITSLIDMRGDCLGIRKEGGVPVSITLLTTLGPTIRQVGSMLYSSLLNVAHPQGSYCWSADLRPI